MSGSSEKKIGYATKAARIRAITVVRRDHSESVDAIEASRRSSMLVMLKVKLRLRYLHVQPSLATQVGQW